MPSSKFVEHFCDEKIPYSSRNVSLEDILAEYDLSLDTMHYKQSSDSSFSTASSPTSESSLGFASSATDPMSAQPIKKRWTLKRLNR